LSECKIGEGNQYPKGSQTNVALGETGIGVASACLKAKGVKLIVAVDEPPCPQ